MKYSPPLLKATLLRRYKRFLADVELNGEEITVHCANTGSMKNCVVEGSPCWLWDSKNPKRKYRYTWELATTSTGGLAGINTMRANTLVEEALIEGLVDELSGFLGLRREVKVGDSRIDFVLDFDRGPCYVEVKSVTLAEEGGKGLFPDAKSVRAAKHIQELMALNKSGIRTALFFCVQHSGVESVAAATQIDPHYAQLLNQAQEEGVAVIAYQACMSATENRLYRRIEVV